MKYFKCDRFNKIQEVEDSKVKDVPSDWIEVDKNGKSLKKEAKKVKKIKE